MGTRVSASLRALAVASTALAILGGGSAAAMPRSPIAGAGRSAPPAQLWLHGGAGRLSPLAQAHRASDYTGALWEPASAANYTASDRGLGDIRRIVIHVAEGGFASTYTWFRNPAAQASAHYVVSSSGRVAQMVPEQDIAWHAGNWDYNVSSIGIEHAGYTNVTRFPDAQYRGSAALAGSVARRYLIPPDRRHVIGHYQVPDPFHHGQFGGADHHTDPGRTWNWPRYMAYVRMDSAQTWTASADNGDAGVEHSSAWKVEASSGAVGGSYLRTASHRGDPVAYGFRLPATDGYDVYAHWPCVAGLPRSADVKVESTHGTVAVPVSERRCGEWRYLGTWPMSAGAGPRVLIGSRSGRGGSVVADGVRLVETHDPVLPGAVRVRTTASIDSLSFSWPAAHDNIGVGAYQLWVDGARVYEGGALGDTVPLGCGTTHLVSLRVVDLAGNRSAAQRLDAATLPCPSPVADLQVTGTTQTTVTLDWQPGGGTVSGYAVYYAGGAEVAETPAFGYTVTGLTCGTGYAFSVRALDSAGDHSDRVVVPASTAPC